VAPKVAKEIRDIVEGAPLQVALGPSEGMGAERGEINGGRFQAAVVQNEIVPS
jgi:hypothetical protein